MATATQPVIPNEFFTKKSLFTLTGASASVWLICLVIHSICYKFLDEPDYYKIIALLLSEALSISMIIDKENKLKDWIIGFINGILIFIYATGFNTISSNIFSPQKSPDISYNQADHKSSSFIPNTSFKVSYFGLFSLSDIDWWPNKRLIEENINLKRKLNILDSLNKIKYNYNILSNADTLKTDTLRRPSTDYNSTLKIENQKLRQQVLEQQNLLNKLNQKPAAPADNSSVSDQIKQLEDQLQACRKNKSTFNINEESITYKKNLDSLSYRIKYDNDKYSKSISELNREIERWKKRYNDCISDRNSL